LVGGEHREPGDVFEVSQETANHLVHARRCVVETIPSQDAVMKSIEFTPEHRDEIVIQKRRGRPPKHGNV
jgi:hypothetical protein